MWDNAAEAYYFVMNHPKLLLHKCIEPWVEITPHMVDSSGVVSENPSQNTVLEWWVECGPYSEDEEDPSNLIVFHDIDLDCGANKAEDAVMELARLVKNKYGDYE